MKKELPETSLEANRMATEEMRNNHRSKIIKALQVLGSANYEQIATYLTLEPHAVGRRMKELVLMDIVFKPGTKLPTKSGRDAYVYTLQKAGRKVKTKNIKSLLGNGISDYSKKLIQTPTLFDDNTLTSITKPKK